MKNNLISLLLPAEMRIEVFLRDKEAKFLLHSHLNPQKPNFIPELIKTRIEEAFSIPTKAIPSG